MTKSKLAVALRSKFSSPKDVLRRLGLDQDLLGAGPNPNSATGGDNDLRDLRVDLENLLAGMKNLPEGAIAKILDLLDAHVDLDALPDDHPQADRVRSLAEQAGDATEQEADFEKFRVFLRRQGFSEGDIENALGIAKNAIKNAAGLPKNALAGGYGGALGMDSLARIRPDLAAGERLSVGTRGVSIGKGFVERHPEAARVF